MRGSNFSRFVHFVCVKSYRFHVWWWRMKEMEIVRNWCTENCVTESRRPAVRFRRLTELHFVFRLRCNLPKGRSYRNRKMLRSRISILSYQVSRFAAKFIWSNFECESVTEWAGKYLLCVCARICIFAKSTRLYKSPCRLVGPSVGWLVRRSVATMLKLGGESFTG